MSKWKPNTVTPTMVRVMCELLDAGESYAAIGRMMGCRRETVRYHVDMSAREQKRMADKRAYARRRAAKGKA